MLKSKFPNNFYTSGTVITATVILCLMFSKKRLIIIVTLLSAGLLFTIASKASYLKALPVKSPDKAVNSTKLRICPVKWYKNEQPCVYQNSPAECQRQRSEYFVINGERKGLDEVDVEWIKKNCEVNKPEVVY